MNPRLLDVLHDPPDVHLLPVRDGIDIDLNVILHELIDKDRMLRVGADARPQIQVEILVVVDDLHPPSAEDVRGTHDHGIAELTGDLAGLIGAPSCSEAGVRDLEIGQQATEAGAVLGQVYGVGGGAQDISSVLLQLSGELQGTLTTKL